MRRREFITLLGGATATWPIAARGQLAETLPLIGLLFSGSEPALARYLRAFRDGMYELGYRNKVRLEYRFAEGYLDRLPTLAAELVKLNPNVIVAAPLPSILAARQATGTIPIVMASSADPVGFGLVKSLARPGGNVTGLANYAEQLASKQLDFLRDLIPHLSRLAVLANVSNPLHVSQLRAIEEAAGKVRIELTRLPVRNPDELETSLGALVHEPVDALVVPPDTLFNTLRRRIVGLAAAIRVPAMYGFRESVEDGGLMSYGVDVGESYRRAATYVDRILRGTPPAELPVEQPTKVELVINLKTAKALGLDIPATVLARADEVIE